MTDHDNDPLVSVTMRFDDLPDGQATRVMVGETPAAVVRVGDDVYAIGDVCSHGHFSLSGGEVWCDELEIECPKHGSVFSLVSGVPGTLPATQPVPVFDVAVHDGVVTVSPKEG